MRRRVFSRPTANKKIRGKIAKRKVRNSFLRVIGGTRAVKALLGIFRGSVIAWIVLIAMGGFVVFATVSSYFHIKKITLQRDEVSLDVERVTNELKDFYGRNLLFLKEEEITQYLLEKFPDFREVNVKEKWPNQIELTVVLSPPVFNVFNVETANFSVVSADGVILDTQVNEGLPVLRVSQYEKILNPRDRFMTKDDIEKILSAEAFAIDDLELDVEGMHYLSAAREIHIIGRNEMAIWVDLQTDIPSQFRKLRLAAERIGLYKRDFEHIDLRIPNQLFWKQR